MMEKFQRKQTITDFKSKCNTKSYKLYIVNNPFVSPIYTFSLAGIIIVYRPIQGTIRYKKDLIILSIKGKSRLWREINASPSISSFIDRVFSVFRRRKYDSNPSEMDIKVAIPAPTQ